MNKLPTESQIINRINSDWNKPVVTFLCTSFNQEDYIEDTIKGFLNQKTSFPYEIIIHDDNSTDNTKIIIEKYKRYYPNIINVIFQTENKYSKGYSTILIAARLARSNYIAICEGDDYWIDVNKIEKQYKLMSDDSSITMSVAPSRIMENEKLIDNIHGYHGSATKVISAQEILNMYSSLAATPSYMVKTTHLIKALDLFESAPVSDIFIEIYNAVCGKLIYYPDVSVVFRKMSKNSWTERMAQSLVASNKHTTSLQKIIDKSKSFKEFEHLDWSLKLSNSYFNLAMSHLNHQDFPGFKENIEISNAYRKLKGKKKILFNFRKSPHVIDKLIIPLGRLIKRL